MGGTRVEQRIEPSLGVVVVDVWGALLQVRLDPMAVRATDPSTVDKRILCAIHAAEQRAAQLVDDYLRRSKAQA